MSPKLRSLEEIAELVYGPEAIGKSGKPVIIKPAVPHFANFAELMDFCEMRGLMIVDYKFTDLMGRWHHFSTPIHHLDENVFVEGLGFDGSSIRAFQDIHESDMMLMPDISTAVIDPVMQVPTLSLTCNILNPDTHEPYNKDTRWVATKAENYLKESGIAEKGYWGPEAEFFVFDGVRFDEVRYDDAAGGGVKDVTYVGLNLYKKEHGSKLQGDVRFESGTHESVDGVRLQAQVDF